MIKKIAIIYIILSALTSVNALAIICGDDPIYTPPDGGGDNVCEPLPDVNDFIFVLGDFIISAEETITGNYYVQGDVYLEQGKNKNKTTLNGDLYAVGDIYLGNHSIVTGFAYSENGVIYSNEGGQNIEVISGTCECGESIPPPGSPPDFSEVIEELESQCSVIFPTPLQGQNTSVELELDGNVTELDEPELSFTPDINGDGVCITDTGSYSCDAIGHAQPLSSSFSFDEDNGSEVDLTVESGKTVTIGVVGASLLGDGDNEGVNGEFNNIKFGKIEIENGGELIFSTLSGNVYEINELEAKGSDAKITFAPAEYAISQVTLEQVVDVTALSGEPIYIFSENKKFIFDVQYTGSEADFNIISNENVYIELTGGTSLTSKIYAAGEIKFTNVDGNDDLVNFYGALTAGDDGNETDGMYIGEGVVINNVNVCGVIPPVPDVYTFTFDGTQTQALTCEAHAVDIQARINGAIDTGYTNTINITTSSGLGDWVIGNANGTLDNDTPGDGAATYQFVDGDDGQIALYLSHATSGPVTVSVDNTDVDVPATIGLTFSAAIIKTELSCVDDALGPCINTANLPFTMTMTAVETDEQTNKCVNYNPTEVNFWSDYQSPSSPTGLAVEVEGVEIGKSESDARSLNVTFTNGVATVAVNYPDAGQIAINVKDATSSSDIEGEAETIVNPLQLLVENINATNGNSNPATTDSGNGFSRASVADYSNLVVETFDLTVTGLKDCSNDTQGHCSGTYGQRTPSFASEIDLQTSLVFPASGTLGNLQYDGDDGYKAALTSGQFTYEDLAYDEVGSFGLTASTVDGYLITGNNIETAIVQTIGRFYPDYLAFNSFSATPACATGDFTYLGQISIDVSYNMQAYAEGGQNITTNYDQSIGYPVAGENGSTVFYDQAYDQAALQLTARLLPDDYYLPSSWIAGQYNVIGQNMGIAKDTSPDGPYLTDNRVDYFIKLMGIDGEKIQTDSATTCAEDSCFIGDLGDLVYGRLQAGNGHGSEYQAIRTDITSTYFDGTRFVDFESDDCTTVSMYQVSSDPSKNASNEITIEDSISDSSGTTTLSIINSPLVDGRSQFNFSAPGSRGQLDYYINVDTVAPWLLDSGNAVDCPDGAEDSEECISGAVEFGLFRGNDRIIYRLQTFD